MSRDPSRYTTTYANFDSDVSARIRQEVFGEDIGQNSWTTAEELMRFGEASGLGAGRHLLEVGCGAGGPALYLARRLGLMVTGIDINEEAIAAANAAAERAGLAGRAAFMCVDGGATLPFDDRSFDAIQLIDAINHIPDRKALFGELHRLLRPGGTLLYTDPVVITGPVAAEEFAARSAIGFFLFVPEGENERMLGQCGFDLLAKENVTANTATISARRVEARLKWRRELIEIEGEESYEASLAFPRAVHALSSSGRLSRFMYLARRPSSPAVAPETMR